jgi:hypothetical protein
MKTIPNEFTRFEHDGWQRVADNYDSVWSRVTRQFIPYLCDAAGVLAECRCWMLRADPDMFLPLSEAGSEPNGCRFLEENGRDRHENVSRNYVREGDAQELPVVMQAYDRVLMNFGCSISRSQKEHARKHFAFCDREESLDSLSGRNHTKIPAAKL